MQKKKCNKKRIYRYWKNSYFRCMKNLILYLILLVSVQLTAQKHIPFSGRMIYNIEFRGTNDSVFTFQSKSVLYTNDTLVRIESETGQLGPQVLIKHLLFKKYYLLLEYENQKYALQQHLPADTIPTKFAFKKKRGTKKIAGLKAKRVLVSHPNFKQPIEMWYVPSFSPKYLDVLKGIKGLPVDYYIQMEDGLLHYVLESVEASPVNMDLFGIPSDFQKISFDEFLNILFKAKSE